MFVKYSLAVNGIRLQVNINVSLLCVCLVCVCVFVSVVHSEFVVCVFGSL